MKCEKGPALVFGSRHFAEASNIHFHRRSGPFRFRIGNAVRYPAFSYIISVLVFDDNGRAIPTLKADFVEFKIGLDDLVMVAVRCWAKMETVQWDNGHSEKRCKALEKRGNLVHWPTCNQNSTTVFFGAERTLILGFWNPDEKAILTFCCFRKNVEYFVKFKHCRKRPEEVFRPTSNACPRLLSRFRPR